LRGHPDESPTHLVSALLLPFLSPEVIPLHSQSLQLASSQQFTRASFTFRSITISHPHSSFISAVKSLVARIVTMARSSLCIAFNNERTWLFMPDNEQRDRYRVIQDEKYAKNDFKKLAPIDSNSTLVSPKLLVSLARWPHMPNIVTKVRPPVNRSGFLTRVLHSGEANSGPGTDAC
jgi:hypothetical protein